MSDYLTTKEVAALLRLKERKVYDLAAKNEIPHLKATGKLLFPRTEIESWMHGTGFNGSTYGQRPLVALGSHDPLLEWSLAMSGSGLATLFQGSLEGLDQFKAGAGVMCGLHIEHLDSDGWNLEIVQTEFKQSAAVLMHWAIRERGLIVRKGSLIQSIAHIGNARVAIRQKTAGASHSFERRLHACGLEVSNLDIVREAQTETEAALAVLENQADVCFGLRTYADRYDLEFIPICEESFDLLIDRHAFFEPPLQALFRFVETQGFNEEVSRYAGYDLSGLGDIRFNGGG